MYGECLQKNGEVKLYAVTRVKHASGFSFARRPDVASLCPSTITRARIEDDGGAVRRRGVVFGSIPDST